MGRTSGAQHLGSLTPTLGNLIVADGTVFDTLPLSGTDNFVLTEDTGQALDMSFQASPGATGFVQQIRDQLRIRTVAAGLIPWDNSVPAITEGTEVETSVITPDNGSNILLIEYTAFAFMQGSPSEPITVALFVDATAAALAAASSSHFDVAGSDRIALLQLRHFLVAGSTVARTYRIRVGQNTGGNNTELNGDSAGVQLYGGIASAVMTVTEYTP